MDQVLFAVIFAVIMIIIYGGIQPDGLVLSVHKVIINTTGETPSSSSFRHYFILFNFLPMCCIFTAFNKFFSTVDGVEYFGRHSSLSRASEWKLDIDIVAFLQHSQVNKLSWWNLKVLTYTPDSTNSQSLCC